MKKLLTISILILMMAFTTTTFAADEYQFELEYEGEIVANEEKEAKVILSGTDATAYSKVRIKIDFVSGPGTPKILATDSGGTQFDLGQLGYWGPEAGFAVGGTFSNVTPIKATYPEAGTYVHKLSLINLENSNAVIAEREFTITVAAQQVPPTDENPGENNNQNMPNEVVNNTIEEIPQTGISAFEYGVCAIVVAGTIFFAYQVMNKRNS